MIAMGLWAGCRPVKDPAPESDDIPQEVASNVLSFFPGATDMVAKTLVQEKVWRVNFKKDASRYVSVLNKTQPLAHARMLDSEVPVRFSSMVSGLLIVGGTYSNFREDDSSPGYPYQFCADYSWNGEKFTVRWVNTVDDWTSGYRALYMFPQTEVAYYSLYADLPVNIQALVTARYKQPGGAKVYVRKDGPLVFAVGYLNNSLSNYDMLIDGNGRIFYSAMGKLDNYDTLDAFPVQIQNYIKAHPAYGAMNYHAGLRFEDGEFRGYRVDLKPKSIMIGWEDVNLYFDRDGNLVETYFTTTY